MSVLSPPRRRRKKNGERESISLVAQGDRSLKALASGDRFPEANPPYWGRRMQKQKKGGGGEHGREEGGRRTGHSSKSWEAGNSVVQPQGKPAGQKSRKELGWVHTTETQGVQGFATIVESDVEGVFHKHLSG